MRNALLVILSFIAFAFTSCKKSEGPLPPPLTGDSYFPQTYGSSWTYRDSIYGEPTDTAAAIYGVKINNLVFTMNGDSTNFNGRLCYNAAISAVQNSVGPSTAYFYAFKHLYTVFESTPPYGLIALDILVDTASAGFTWTSIPTFDHMLNGNPVKTINTIVQKNITRVIGGKTFTNVTHTSANLQTNISNAGYKNIAYFDFYVAKGIGLIEKDAYIYGSFNETRTIIDYTIK
jgi:hypothetical protein